MSRILVETIVKKTLKDMKEDPERSIRNLVDMALYFSKEGRFQKDFFQAAQTMLENENSPYYALLRNLVSSADTERLACFGINLGYNSCTLGAEKIRKSKKFGYSIPWFATLQAGGLQISRHLSEYLAAVAEGEKSGIYSWMLFARSHPQELLPLIQEHPDSAFFLFCDPDDINTVFLDSISDINNLMLVIRYEKTADALYEQIRGNGLLHSAYYPYSQEDIESITGGDLFYSIQQAHPVFTVLLAQPDCPGQFRMRFIRQ